MATRTKRANLRVIYPSMAKAKFGKCFSKMLDYYFSCFAKKTKITIIIGKLLEMLLIYD
jgi:hypothetical protein